MLSKRLYRQTFYTIDFLKPKRLRKIQSVTRLTGGGVIQRVEEFCVFRLKSSSISETDTRGAWIINRKSQVCDRSISLSMTLSDLNAGHAAQFSTGSRYARHTVWHTSTEFDVVTHVGTDVFLYGTSHDLQPNAWVPALLNYWNPPPNKRQMNDRANKLCKVTKLGEAYNFLHVPPRARH